MSIREYALGKHGTFARVSWSRPCKVKKNAPAIIKTVTANNVRIGAQYDALASTKKTKGVNTTEEAHSLNTGLKGMSWVVYPTILKSDRTGKEFVRMETAKNSKFTTEYSIDGRKVNRKDIEGYLLASEKKSGCDMPTVMNVGMDNITDMR